jgi:predicted TIM-barrel fold metal-dependent hydrolase
VTVNRRTFLGSLAAGVAGAAAPTSIPIIDTHIHLFDPTRPGGIPWPPKSEPVLYRPALPARYREVTKSLGVAGAIEVECSPWFQDNQWVLDVCAKDPIMVGAIGDLEPEKAEFRKHLDRFHRNPLFLGIRCGNLWGRDFHGSVRNPQFLSGAKALADANLVMDIANPTPELVSDIVRLTDQVPTLRVVIDHLPAMEPVRDADALRSHQANLRELGKRPQIYAKVSEVLRKVDGKTPLDPQFYRPRLDELWEVFGEDRLLFGSDWPNSDLWGSYPQVLGVVRGYFAAKGDAAAEKYFWRNSRAAYRWVKRGQQPG